MSIFSVATANATWCCCWPTTVYIPLSLISWPAAGFTNHNGLSVCSSCFLRSVSLKFDEFLLWRIKVFRLMFWLWRIWIRHGSRRSPVPERTNLRLQNCLNSLWHTFKKMTEKKFLWDSGPYWSDVFVSSTFMMWISHTTTSHGGIDWSPLWRTFNPVNSVSCTGNQSEMDGQWGQRPTTVLRKDSYLETSEWNISYDKTQQPVWRMNTNEH